MFRRRRWLELRAVIWLIIALGLMVLNLHSAKFKAMRSHWDAALYPLEYALSFPLQAWNWLSAAISTEQELLRENASLRSRQLLLEARLQKMIALEQENAQLKTLLGSIKQINHQYTVAGVLEVNLTPLQQEIVLNQGKNNQIYVGQPVLDAYGVIGQVIAVNPVSSRVLLITDRRSGLAVQDSRSGFRAILVGTGNLTELNLRFVPHTADVQVGDIFITSGLGGGFPFGYPVAEVTQVDKKINAGFIQVVLKPIAHIDSSRELVLIWPDENHGHRSSHSPTAAAKTP